jgi:predicted membrane channel-forming protein YqfA (hemolysin III family)
MYKPAARLVGISLSAWVLWSLLIYAARPGPPEGVSKVIFLISMVLAAGACVSSCWHLFPQQSSKRWRRPVNVLIGIVAFLAILGVGHSIGNFIAQST